MKAEKKSCVKAALITALILVYLMLLFYISSIQSDYRITIHTPLDHYLFCNEGVSEYVIPLSIENYANRLLSSAEDQNIFICYHVYDSQGNLLVYDNPRSQFEKPVFCGETGEAQLHMALLDDGEYIIEIDLLQEGVTWFGQQEDTQKRITVTVRQQMPEGVPLEEMHNDNL